MCVRIFFIFLLRTLRVRPRETGARRRCLFRMRMRIYYFLILLFIYMLKRKGEFSEDS